MDIAVPEINRERLLELGFKNPSGALFTIGALGKGALGDKVADLVLLCSKAPSPDGAINNIESIFSNMDEALSKQLLALPDFLPRLVAIAGASNWLSNTAVREPGILGRLFLEGGLFDRKGYDVFRSELSALCKEDDAIVPSFDEISGALRDYKQKEFLRIGSRDLLRLAPMEELTAELSDLASASLDVAVAFSYKVLKAMYGAPLYEDETGAAKEAGFTVIGMGKLGGRELNFSSDIDILYIYSSDKGETSGRTKVSLHVFFVKLAMSVTKLISAPTDMGIVFRVDLDLRPEGRSGDVANSLRSAEIYYESWGQSWERSAMIKARPVAGDMSLGKGFMDMIKPFVFRRYLDFTAIEEIKAMKEKIDLSLLRSRPDVVDVKLGTGGIREIEFFCQALQLIYGGKRPELRSKGTIQTIRDLEAQGLLTSDNACTLRSGYKFLRDVEHRIQIVDGRQSQAIPTGSEPLVRLARMMGFENDAEFLDEFRARTVAVHEVYRTLFYKSDEEFFCGLPEDVVALASPDIDAEDARHRLSRLGFLSVDEASGDLRLLKDGPRARVSARSRSLLERLVPLILDSASKSANPDRALRNLERFVSAIGARTAFYALLAENPGVIAELAKLFCSSEFLSRALIEQPGNIELLLSMELAVPVRTKAGIEALFSAAETEAGDDYEQRLSAMRRVKSQELFRIGVNDVLGRLSSRSVSSQITSLAECALDSAIRCAYIEVGRVYGHPSSPAFGVIGLGKLGSRELGYGSDLDIVFVYGDGSAERQTTGGKEVTEHEFYVKLAQRVISALTLKTREGFVFNVDARLRPSGSSGPLVISKGALLDYHATKALAWERQAFTRARACAGDLRFALSITRELREVVYSKPLSGEDALEMLRIRKRMEDEIAREGPGRYNIKTGKGALVDIEFLTQALALKHGGVVSSLRAPQTLKALKRLCKEGFLSPDDLETLVSAYRFYRRLETGLRIVNDRPEGYLNVGSDELDALARGTGFTGSHPADALLGEYEKRSAMVRAIYLRVIEGIAAGN